ncbi:MAG TPA: tRNA (N(6)-L-threonylcarbamoyladenosine(37)-C(2))-methylthiotransferase MtaB [Magnetospirillaceae bacterium]
MTARDPEIVTFGCRLNTYESEVMKGHARAAGLSDTVIVNTCAVTNEAERQARQAIRRLRRERPEARIVVTGCAAQIDPARFAAMPEVDQVIGNAEKMDAATWRAEGAERVRVGDIAAQTSYPPTSPSPSRGEGIPIFGESFFPPPSEGEGQGGGVPAQSDRARAFVEVQQGCDHRCTFCIIPQGRGPSRSVPVGGVVERVRSLVTSGFREVVLTGVDLTAYGGDLPGKPGLGALARRLLNLVPELERLRLSSLDPVEVDDELVALFAGERRLMPHVHLSVQAGDDAVLKRMARRHRRDDVIALAQRLRAARPGLAIGADIIVGFPGETEEGFANSLALVDEAGLTHLHVFPYSPRPGTPAAKWKPVAGPEIRRRAAALRAKGEDALAAYAMTRIGADAAVLVEKDGVGRCEHYLPVRFAMPATTGSVVALRITGTEGATLQGELAA